MLSKLHTVAIEENADGYRAFCGDCTWKGERTPLRADAETSAEAHTTPEAPRLASAPDVAPAPAGAGVDPRSRPMTAAPADASGWEKGVALRGRSLQHASAFGVYHLTEVSDEAGRVVGWAVWKQDGSAWSEVGAATDDASAAALAKAHYEAYVSPLPRCVVCSEPFAQGCNGTAACSLECEDAAWNSPDRDLYYPDAAEEPLSADEARQNVIDAGGL
jgi:hypothetical protein